VQSPSGLISVAGGKYTTLSAHGRSHHGHDLTASGRRGPCGTRDCALDGALPVAQASVVQASGVSHDPGSSRVSSGKSKALRRNNNSLEEESARHLVTRYGSRARDVRHTVERPEGLTRIVPDAPDYAASWRISAINEMPLIPRFCSAARDWTVYPEIIGTRI